MLCFSIGYNPKLKDIIPNIITLQIYKETMELCKQGVWNRKLMECIIVSNLVILWLVLSSGIWVIKFSTMLWLVTTMYNPLTSSLLKYICPSLEKTILFSLF